MERSAPVPTDAEPEGVAVRPPSHYATHLRETLGSLFLYGSMSGMLAQPDTHAYKAYIDRLLEDCGSPTDPVEVMLVEQVALAHMNIGRLYFRSATAEGLEGARAYGMLAIALTGEFRRTALALQAYRAAARPLAAAGGEGHATLADGAVAAPKPREEGLDGGLASTEATDHGGGAIRYPESASGGGGASEPAEAEGAQRRRPRKPAGRRAG